MVMNNPAFRGANASGTGHLSWPSVSSLTFKFGRPFESKMHHFLDIFLT